MNTYLNKFKSGKVLILLTNVKIKAMRKKLFSVAETFTISGHITYTENASTITDEFHLFIWLEKQFVQVQSQVPQNCRNCHKQLPTSVIVVFT